MINLLETPSALNHGGNLQQASEIYGVSMDAWLDMSTGISPWSYPVDDLPSNVWRDLPPSNDELIATAKKYYQIDEQNVVVSPGSQLSIRLLPQLFAKSKVALPVLGYQEHALSWKLAGHQLCFYQNVEELIQLIEDGKVDHAVVINPNNPSCEKTTKEKLSYISNSIKGVLLVDEAFMDFYQTAPSQIPESSFGSAISLNAENVIVVRSIGKFFGLAGLRLGFVIGLHPVLQKLQTLFQPWAINHASMLISRQALADTQWQEQQRLKIKAGAKQLEPLLFSLCQDFQELRIENTALFCSVFAQSIDVQKLHKQLAMLGVWTRMSNPDDKQAWLRFGLVGDMESFKQRIKKL